MRHGLALEDPATWSAQLVECLGCEGALLERLEAVLLAQRAAVELDDLEALEEGTHAARKVLRTLGEARRKRAALLEIRSGRPELPLGDLERAGLGPTAELIQARDELRRTARRVGLALSLNRRLLAEAARTADRDVRALLGTAGRAVQGYPGGPVEGRSLDCGRHVNEQV